MLNPNYRALVVDDEAIARRMLTFALEQEGFACDAAHNGVEASGLISGRAYDLVVTDVLMPHKHGHALVVDLLATPDRPVLIVHTSVDDPRLTKDLLIRGVDDIVYKPTNYATFAARAAAFIERRKLARGGAVPQVAPDTAPPEPAPCAEGDRSACLSRDDVNRRLADVSAILPVSETALEVYRLATKEDAKAADIARGIKKDAALAADLLRAGNSAHYNRSAKPITDIGQLVVGVGSRRVSELALAASARSLVTKQQIPWLNVELAWKRSMAAGMALDALVAQGGHESVAKDLFLSALMYPLGRVVLATLFPVRHEMLTSQCSRTGEALSQAEERVFFKPHTEIMATLLAGWNIPPAITNPLMHALAPFAALRTLPKAERLKVELVKLAVLLGRLSVGAWEPWDTIDFPPTALLERLRIRSMKDIVAETRKKIEQVATASQTETQEAESAKCESAVQPIGYWKSSWHTFDFLAAICPVLGVEPIPSDLDTQPLILANCLESESAKQMDHFKPHEDQAVLIVAQKDSGAQFARFGRVVELPTSLYRLQHAVSQSCPEHVHVLG